MENSEKLGIGITDIKNEVEQLLKQSNVAERESKNLFPVEVFPLPVQEIITATNESLKFPIDFIGASMLYAASVAIGNTYKVEITAGWKESAVVYLAIVARPGTNKSHPLHFALQPIMDQDKKTYAQYEQARQEYENAVRLSKTERQEQGIDEPVKPVWNKLLLSDFTPEALAEVHKFNKRGIGVYCDELAGWFKNFNRYNKGSEMEFWISAFNSMPINIDRKTKEPVFIPLPFIPVAGTLQTGILNELAKENRTQNGFIDRILFVIPDNIVKEYWSEIKLNPIIIENWHNIIASLLGMPIQLDETFNPDPEILRFGPEAKRILSEWQRTNSDQCNKEEEEIIWGIYSKLEIYAARLALILEIMRWACNESDKQSISIKSVEGALQLVEYFKRSAVKVHSILSNANPLDKLPADKQNLYKSLPANFTTVQGVQIAESLGIPERSFKRFITDKEFFNHLARGEYEKKI
jgi:hypothetical protein